MSDVLNNILFQIRWLDFLDIAVVTFVIYKIIQFIQETRAEQLLKGLIVLFIFTEASGILQLYTINWVLRNTLTVGVIAVLIIFQPELRRALQYLGKGTIFNRYFKDIDPGSAEKITENIMQAVKFFSRNKIGSLIVLEREIAIGEIIETGTRLDSEISKELLINLFNTAAPLHDGAVIIRRDRIIAAGCVLPLTANNNLSSELGTRHRAGIGVTEHSDAVVLIVSEETGAMSVAMNGSLSRFMDTNAMETVVRSIYLDQGESKPGKFKPFIDWIRGHGNE